MKKLILLTSLLFCFFSYAEYRLLRCSNNQQDARFVAILCSNRPVAKVTFHAPRFNIRNKKMHLTFNGLEEGSIVGYANWGNTTFSAMFMTVNDRTLMSANLLSKRGMERGFGLECVLGDEVQTGTGGYYTNVDAQGRLGVSDKNAVDQLWVLYNPGDC